MSKIDIILLVILFFCAWLGYRQGIVRMGMALTGMFFSVLILYWKWSETLLFFYSWNIQNPYILLLFMLGMIALITAVFVWIAGWIERLFKLVFLDWVNKLAGMFLAVVAGIFIMSLLIIIVTVIPPNKPILSKVILQRSVFAQVVLTIEQYTPIDELLLKNFDRLKDRITVSSTENKEP